MHRWLRSRAPEAPLDEAAWAPVAALLAAYEEPKRTVDPFVAAGPALAREAARREAATAPRRLPWFRLMPLTAAVALLLISVSTPPVTEPEVRVMTPAGAEVGTPSVASPSFLTGETHPLADAAACPTPVPLSESPAVSPAPSPTCAPELQTGPR